MGQSKNHKICIQEIINKLKTTHLSVKEFPIFRGGDVHYLDTVGFPNKNNSNQKPFALECEIDSSKLQKNSNHLDLQEFKLRYPESEVFQLESPEQFDINKLKIKENSDCKLNNFGECKQESNEKDIVKEKSKTKWLSPYKLS